jgi:outer membrane protein OmpA-like peptidoglycan-associated protein
MRLVQVQEENPMTLRSSARRPRTAPTAVALALALATASAGCQSVPASRTTQGAVLGSMAGAATGVAVAKEGHNVAGGLVGAAAGAVAGGLIGRYLDNQAQQIDAIPDANVERQSDRLVVTFPGDTLFDSGSSSITPGAAQRLDQLAQTLEQYPASDILIRGYTDSIGSEASNLRLSEDRANNVRNYLINRGVAPARITAMGFGEQFPLASNSTESGRQQNRRVEVEIRPEQDQLRESSGRN